MHALSSIESNGLDVVDAIWIIWFGDTWRHLWSNHETNLLWRCAWELTVFIYFWHLHFKWTHTHKDRHKYIQIEEVYIVSHRYVDNVLNIHQLQQSKWEIINRRFLPFRYGCRWGLNVQCTVNAFISSLFQRTLQWEIAVRQWVRAYRRHSK